MRNLTTLKSNNQCGFTLIELVIVIVIIGILAAVAIPNFSSTADEARLAKQQATLGMLKGAWASAYATKKGNPTCAEIVAKTLDPVCTGTTAITCTGVTRADGTGTASFTCTEAGGVVASPASIVCAVAGC